MTTKKKLCAVKGISEAKMEKIKEASNKLCVGLQFFPTHGTQEYKMQFDLQINQSKKVEGKIRFLLSKRDFLTDLNALITAVICQKVCVRGKS